MGIDVGGAIGGGVELGIVGLSTTVLFIRVWKLGRVPRPEEPVTAAVQGLDSRSRWYFPAERIVPRKNRVLAITVKFVPSWFS